MSDTISETEQWVNTNWKNEIQTSEEEFENQ